MRKPRVRFREFLFLVTLASLIAATIALRSRVAYHETAMAHAFWAARARAHSRWLVERVAWTKGRLETAATPADQARWQAELAGARAALAKTAGEAERHERLARHYAP